MSESIQEDGEGRTAHVRAHQWHRDDCPPQIVQLAEDIASLLAAWGPEMLASDAVGALITSAAAVTALHKDAVRDGIVSVVTRDFATLVEHGPMGFTKIEWSRDPKEAGERPAP